jgi:DNA-binding helix-hairpin-helix protein with protein kinase domain
LRHRLHLLEEVAWLLHRVHSRGLVFGDVSPGNIVAPGPEEDGSIWLIDTDNLHFAGARSPGRFGTPGFVAPEVRAGGDVSIESDRYSLAVLIVQVLTLVHPVNGQRVPGLPTTEVQVRSDGVPWLQRGATSDSGVPSELVLTRRLDDLTAATFALGDISPAARPSAADWSEALIQAAALVLRCGSCEATFYAWSDTCPWCGARRPAHVQVHDADLLLRETGGVESLLGVVQPGDPLQLAGDGALVPKSRAERPTNLRVRAGAGAEVVWVDCAAGTRAERCDVEGARASITTRQVPMPCADAGTPREWVQLRYGNHSGRRVAFRASR